MIFDGEVVSDLVLRIRFSIGGKIDKLNYQIGQRVKRGQLLARLDQSEFQLYLDRALKLYEKERASFEEKQKLVLSEFDQTQIQMSLDVAVKNVEIAKKNLEETNLYSPISGIVVAADSVVAGMNITPAGLTIIVVDPESFYFSVAVSETKLKLFEINKEVKIKLNIFPLKKTVGKIERVSFVLNKDKYPVAISLSEKEGLRLGLKGKLEFVTAKKN